jgi:hypothetical protein
MTLCSYGCGQEAIHQYAENGGEFYIEVDEPFHYDVNENLREKDILRQNVIIEYLKCNFIRLKNERIE